MNEMDGWEDGVRKREREMDRYFRETEAWMTGRLEDDGKSKDGWAGGTKRVCEDDLQSFQELPDAALFLLAHHHAVGGHGRQVAAAEVVQVGLGAVGAKELQVLGLHVQSP